MVSSRMHRVVVVLALLAGCSSFIEEKAASSTYALMKKGNVAARRLSDVQLVREAAAGGVVQSAVFAASYPKHRGFQELHAESLCQYAIGFVFDDWEDASLGGRDDAARAIATRLDGLLASCVEVNLALLGPTWRAAFADAAGWKALVASAKRAQAPALLWIASVDAVRLALDPMSGLARLDRTIGTLERSIALAPGQQDAAAEILLGALLAGKSRFLGGPDGEAMFTAARRALGDGAIIVDVMIARGLAVARQDRAMYTRTLERALAADLTRWPALRLPNELARVKARRYLAAIDRLIPPAP